MNLQQVAPMNAVQDPEGGVRAPETHRIAVLPPEEARKIAAGEVVDRPAALVREFLDNAIDSGAERIEGFIDDGGCRRVEVCDDGEGMDRENLELCTLTHATSKIRRLDDLAVTETLGFRGRPWRRRRRCRPWKLSAVLTAGRHGNSWRGPPVRRHAWNRPGVTAGRASGPWACLTPSPPGSVF